MPRSTGVAGQGDVVDDCCDGWRRCCKAIAEAIGRAIVRNSMGRTRGILRINTTPNPEFKRQVLPYHDAGAETLNGGCMTLRYDGSLFARENNGREMAGGEGWAG